MALQKNLTEASLLSPYASKEPWKTVLTASGFLLIWLCRTLLKILVSWIHMPLAALHFLHPPALSEEKQHEEHRSSSFVVPTLAVLGQSTASTGPCCDHSCQEPCVTLSQIHLESQRPALLEAASSESKTCPL